MISLHEGRGSRRKRPVDRALTLHLQVAGCEPRIWRRLVVRESMWLTRLLTRLVAIVPAIAVTWLYQESGTGELLILSQVILSLQLGFACWPLVRMTGDAQFMGVFVAPRWIRLLGWVATALVVGASLWFVVGAL